MRIAFLADEKQVNGFYRGYAPMTALGHFRGHVVRRLAHGERFPDDFDLLHIHRYCDETTVSMARGAKAAGAVVVWDNDDDQGAMPKSIVTHKHFSGFRWEQRRAEIQRVFQFVDLVTAPNPILLKRLEELGARRTCVVENYALDQHLKVPERPSCEEVTIGWVAGLEHQMDAERLPIAAVLQRLLDERPEVVVATIGLRLGLRSDRYRAIPTVLTTELSLHIYQWDIGIAPLADLAFSRSRSNIKLKEYAAAGLPWLASPVGPYVGLGEREGGRLVSDDRWYEELSRLLDKPRERRKLAKRAVKWVRSETLSANVTGLEAVLLDAIAHS